MVTGTTSCARGEMGNFISISVLCGPIPKGMWQSRAAAAAASGNWRRTSD